MNTSDKNDNDNDSLGDEQDQEVRQILDSIESFEDVCKTFKSKSVQELNAQKTSEVPKSDQEKVHTSSSKYNSTPKTEKLISEADPDSEYTRFLKQMSVRYSEFRIASGQVVQQKGQTMDYRDYNYSEYPVCQPSCSWQSFDPMTQDSTSGQREMESSSSSSPGQMCQNQYGYGQSLPEAGSRSDETIVNDPSTTSSAPCESESPCCSKETCGCCCDIASSQQSGCSQWDQTYPGQQQHIFPVPMGVDPSTGFPIYCYSTPLNYQGNAMYSMPGMQMDESQRGGGGQNNRETGTKCQTSSESSEENCHSNGDSASFHQSPNNLDMEAFMQKYQKSVQQCYATAQQGIQQSFANAQSQPYFNNFAQGTQQFYNNGTEGTRSMFAGCNQAIQIGMHEMLGSPNQDCQGMQQAFSSSFGAQQYCSNDGLGAQQIFSSLMGMPSPNWFASNTGFMSDSLQNHTVYSSDYKPFSNDGNHFNHFPNGGMDMGLATEPCNIYGPAGSPGLVEMGNGGQVYGMGGACDMNMSAYPLSQMSYSSPYSYDMPCSTLNYNPASGIPMATPQMQASHISSGNPVQQG
uniref:AT09606p n=1 Tax=Drosophila melanogaster TaxID=7227 RepID=Q5U0T2_DROME|nr:AT09606p [Drosophila melanogaster]